MKRLILILSILFPILLSAQDYYWYRGNKINLEIGNKEYVIYESDTTPQPYKIIAKDENKQESIIYRTPSYKSPKNSTNDIFVTDRFNVKLRHANDYSILQQMATLYHVEVLSDTVLPLWHTLQCTRLTQYNALELANIFYESEKFAAAEPEFMGIIQPACVNDSDFHLQWNLLNTGLYDPPTAGIDINYCQASSITSGDETIVIAVFDWGVDLSHPDLNIYPLSYNTRDTLFPSQICYESSGKSYHGTACAGIISAISNNELGIAGIAPYCPVMSISLPQYPTAEDIARGFRFAANNNCSVINCSWHTTADSEELADAIVYAIQNGRDGLGCVVVCASGNDGEGAQTRPSLYSDDIIVVGAMSTCAKRVHFSTCLHGEDWDNVSWGSNFGLHLDVVAPGIWIPTTDVTGEYGACDGDYYPSGLSGTSIAAPHVSAVAGLILSVNPQLTAKQVADIIESTAQKVGGYNYAPQEGRTNGTWHQEMGYGLVDAYAAVLAAKTKYIQNQTYQSNNVIVENYPEIIAGYAVTDSKAYGNVVLEAGSNVTFNATDKVVLRPGFYVKLGSKLQITVGTSEIVSVTSMPQRIASNAQTDKIASINEVVANNSVGRIENTTIVSTSIYTISGQLIQTIAGGQRDAVQLPNGMYILQHRMSDESVRNEKIANNK